MTRTHKFIYMFVLLASAGVANAADDPASATFDRAVAPFFKQHCVRCHGPEKQEADFSLQGLTWKVAGDDLTTFEKAVEMVSIGDMPPEDEPQPTDEQRQRFVAWIQSQLQAAGRGATDYERRLPSFANRIDHDALFSGEHQGPAFTPARVWRLNGHIYSQLVQDLDLGRDFIPPLNTLDEGGFDDYDLLYADEATIRTMLQNAKRVAMTMVHGRLIQPRGAGTRDPDARARRVPSGHKTLTEFAAIDGDPTVRTDGRSRPLCV